MYGAYGDYKDISSFSSISLLLTMRFPVLRDFSVGSNLRFMDKNEIQNFAIVIAILEPTFNLNLKHYCPLVQLIKSISIDYPPPRSGVGHGFSALKASALPLSQTATVTRRPT